MIGTQDKRFRIVDDNVQPMEQPRVGIVRFMLVDESFQSRDVAAISVAVDLTARGKSGVGKLLYRRLLDIWCLLHLQEAGIAPLIQ